MRISLLVVGKTMDKSLDTLIQEYMKRIGHYVRMEIKIIPDLRTDVANSLSFEQRKTLEGDLILKEILPSDQVILLDERGKEFRSMEYAQWLNNLFSRGGQRLVFVIGGPYGFSESVYKRAQSMLSLSKMTFSHQMIRLLFVEQFYRALTIINHEPYHHEG